MHGYFVLYKRTLKSGKRIYYYQAFRLISYKKTCTEKDRIIGIDEFFISFEIKIDEYETQRIHRFWRYLEAIQQMLAETETEYSYYFSDEEWVYCIG